IQRQKVPAPLKPKIARLSAPMRLPIFLLYATLTIKAATAAPVPQSVGGAVGSTGAVGGLTGSLSNATGAVNGIASPANSTGGALSSVTNAVTGTVAGVTATLSDTAAQVNALGSNIVENGSSILSNLFGNIRGTLFGNRRSSHALRASHSPCVPGVTDDSKSGDTGAAGSLTVVFNNLKKKAAVDVDYEVENQVGDAIDGLNGVAPPNIGIFASYPPLNTYIYLLDSGE
ncbi:hypothetical protein H0H81_012513, partial [Sphagnurus paluster]